MGSFQHALGFTLDLFAGARVNADHHAEAITGPQGLNARPLVREHLFHWLVDKGLTDHQAFTEKQYRYLKPGCDVVSVGGSGIRVSRWPADYF
jgi:hypothetical protein